ncbi:diiron oxygenase [Actinomadura rugatobispora]|uniref:Diiron oxygenase n=1 Tax=Actinomadura rugatobispora TaxID=1994 RepID=A0ABW1A5Q2_9ACTN|nr:diiron oxygenase [Actinomadura rugatobispora]
MATRETLRKDRAARTRRVERLNTASVRRVIEPDTDVTGDFSQEQIVPDELLSTAGLGLRLTPEQKARLAREEVASMLRLGITFEAALMAGFSFRLAVSPRVTDPRFTYALHEIGEETRHSRLFARVIGQLEPRQRNPLESRLARRARGRALPHLMRRPATLDALVLGGEEVPDLLQRLLAEHPDTDDYLRRISHYHRQEEARHLAYARTTVAEHYARARRSDRLALHWIVPGAIAVMFDMMVQPLVYRTVGLPALRTWRAVRRDPRRVELRRQACRSVLKSLLDAGVFAPGRVPYAWRRACAVDASGVPV